MFEQPDSPTASQTKKSLFDHYLYRLQTEIHTILDGESQTEDEVKSLKSDLAVFKRACFTAEAETRALNDEIKALKEKVDALEGRNKNNKIICLIDGDGTIFSAELMLQAREGGRLAAKQLSESIHYHIPTESQPCHLWTFIFYNKRGLLDTFGRAGGEFRGVREVFDEFVIGFNQSCERFMMVDVGGGKEAADAKIKVLLEEHARSQETYRVVFGGCHDNGYMPQLHSLLTSVYREKLVLLPGYTEMASEIGKLQIPSLVIPGLFLPEKIVTPPFTRTGTFKGAPASVPPTNNTTSELGPPPGLPVSSDKEGDNELPRSTSDTPPPPPYPESLKGSVKDDLIRQRSGSFSTSRSSNSSPERQRVVLGASPGGGPISYRAVVQSNSPPHQHAQAASFNDILQNNREIRQNGNNNSAKTIKQRRINPNLLLSQHDPPPCTLFYLAANGCKHGSECRFGHDYFLNDDDYEAMQANAKKVPCPMANRGEVCSFGDNCCYGHTCPFGAGCRFYRQGKCKFFGANMHDD